MGGPQLVGGLIVAGDACVAGDVFAVGEEGGDGGALAAELVADVGEEALARSGGCRLAAGVDAEDGGGIFEGEQVGVAGADALQGEVAVELVAAGDVFVEAGLQGVEWELLRSGELVVVEGVAGDVGQRVEGEESGGLRGDGDAGRVGRECRLCLGEGGDEAGLGRGIAVAGPLVADEEVGAAADEVADVDGAADGEGSGDAVVGGLGRLEAGDGVGAGVERGVAEEEAEAAGVKALAAVAAVAEGLIERELAGGGVVGAAVDEQAVGGAGFVWLA